MGVGPAVSSWGGNGLGGGHEGGRGRVASVGAPVRGRPLLLLHRPNPRRQCGTQHPHALAGARGVARLEPNDEAALQ
eukprot:14394677-Alexandrium_andersonii.AAC.1